MVDSSNPEALNNSWRIEEWFPDLSAELSKKLKVFHSEVLKMNKSHNLISIKSQPFADALHFADGILSCRIVMRHNPAIKEVYDFGSGAGFPGVIFAVLNPTVSVKLVENDPKKVEFLNHVVRMLGLKNAAVLAQAVEALPDGSVQFAITRGFSNISRTCMAARKAVVKGGSLFHFKGEEWALEVSEMPSQLCSLWGPSLVGDYKLPIGAVKFSVVKTEKIQ